MDIPRGGIYVVLGELSSLLTAMKKNNRWSSNSHQDDSKDILLRGLTDLKDVLNQINVLRELDPNHFLSPFLEVIRSGETTSLITSIALSAVLKFLNYNLIDPKCEYVAVSVNNIANAVTHAKFVGTDTFNDAVVLMKILQILRTLVMSPIGVMLTNKCICDILLSCFRICFERKLNDTLRKFAESSLRDMVQLLFTRLPTFSEETNKSFNIKKLKMRASSLDVKNKHKSYSKRKHKKSESKDGFDAKTEEAVNSESANEPMVLDMQGNIHKDVTLVENQTDTACSDGADDSRETDDAMAESVEGINCTGVVISMEDSYHEPLLNQAPNEAEYKTVNQHDMNYQNSSGTPEIEKEVNNLQEKILEPSETIPTGNDPLIIRSSAEDLKLNNEASLPNNENESTVVGIYSNNESLSGDKIDNITRISNDADDQDDKDDDDKQEMVNQQGVRFTSSTEQQEDGVDQPYSLSCVQQLLRLLASLCNPLDSQNTGEMLQTGLALVLVALEVGADSIAKFPSLLETVKDELCRSLFSLLNSDRLPIFAADVQVCFLLFESLRTHLKFQFQTFLSKLTDIIVTDSKISYEMREISLETVVQLWRIPGLVTELYLNYDCDLYCPNLYEELTNFLSRNAVPDSDIIHNIHLLSLDALLTVIDSIESHCHSRILNERQHFSDSRVEELAMSQVIDPSTNYILREGARHKISAEIPSHEQIMALKRKKKLLSIGTEKFNKAPTKGIEFLREQELLSNPPDSEEVASFLRENPHLDKKMIGDYICNRNNLSVLNSFVKSFDFTDTRIDEALRLYLESFRLPGESPLISLVMEHFADHWHKCNGEPFHSADAAFTLAYAIIMLNVDQHNHNVRRQISPMTCDDFKRNLKNVNGDENFDQKLLDDIYEAIKNDEIVMPAEQSGLVRENYLWKVMLRRGMSRDGVYIRAPSGLYDHNLFAIVWSPTVTALASLFEKTIDPTIYQKAISGFRKCAMISAHYGMSTEFDNLIIALCKFTTLLNTVESAETLTILFGGNAKARLAGKAVFNLAHRHGDIIRDSWRNILDCMLQLYRCKLLPKILVEAEDFIELSGKISLLRDDMMSPMSPKTEASLFSSIYSYISLGAEANANKTPSPEDLEAIKLAQNCIRECHLEQLVTESKFLRFESLQFFIKALLRASYGPEGHVSPGSSYSEGNAVFFLELLLKVIIQNRDRVGVVWPKIKEHIYTLMMGAAACKHQFLVERCVVGMLRLAIRLMRREEMSPVVLQSLRMLLLLKGTLSRVSRQVAYGMFELLKTSAANIHSAADWAVIFTLLECVGAGAPPPIVLSKPSINESGAKSEGECGEVVQMPERGYTSDSELNRVGSGSSSPDLQHNTTGWILVGKEGEVQSVTRPRIVEERDLGPHDPFALVKCCEALSFLVRDVAHITPYNFENCVRCIRTFVQAALYITYEKKSSKKGAESRNSRRKLRGRREDVNTGGGYDADESDADDVPTGYQQVCIQLMDLMYTLHTRTAQIFRWWAEEEGGITEYTSLWQCGWCPLLEGISSLCTHPDRQVRMNAISYLQRGLLVSDLSVLTGSEWESCFTRVLFPLLSRMLEPEHNPSVIEEARIRASTVLSKVFLHHLTPLQTLPSFFDLWMTILDFMDKYMHADNSELLYEAVPESLKNMLLVMDSGGLFNNPDGSRNELWALSWDRILSFLPNLQQELFRPPPPPADTNQANKELPAEEVPLPQSNVIEMPPIPNVAENEIVQQPLSPSHSQSGLNEQPVSQSIVTASLITSSPSNWQPPAPIFPHIGQILSTPIGPMIPMTVEESNVTSNNSQDTLPVYSGFANAPPRPAPPSAQFFYQDMHQIEHSNIQQTDVDSSASSAPNMMNSNPKSITIISTAESSS